MVQQMHIPQTQQLPPEADQLAATHQLGTPQTEYKVRLTKQAITWAVLCAIIGIFFGFVALTSSDSFAMVLSLILGLIFASMALYYIFVPVVYRSWHVYVCTDGFVFTRKNKVEAFRWDQIEAMWQSVTKRYTNGIHTGTAHKYTVRRKDGGQVILNDRFTDVEELGNTISDMIINYQMPQAIDAYNAGNTIPFGPLSISMQGISTGKKLLPWSQVKDIDVQQGMVTIKKEGKRLNWSSVQVAQVPNVFILMALINYILKGQW